MAYAFDDPRDRDALLLYADPTIAPAEKQRRLEALLAPVPPASGPDLRTAQLEGAGGTTGAPESLPDVPPRPIAAGSGGTTGAPPPTPSQNEGAEGAAPTPPVPPTAAAEAPTEDVQVSIEDEPLGPEPGVDPDDEAAAFRRLSLMSRGGAGVPMERVTEQVSARQGSLSPGQRGEHAGALTEHEQATADLATLEADQAQQQRDLDVQRREAEMAERDRLAQVRAETVAKAAEVDAQRQKISQELTNLEAPSESLFAAQNFGEKLVTFIGLLALGAGLGATGNANQIVPTVQAMARREADQQKRLVELKHGQLSTLGTMYERHMQNLQDAELASKATQADILARFELELAKYGREMGPSIDQAKLAQNLAGLRAARIEAEGQFQKAFGDQVETQVQRNFMRPIAQPKPTAPASPAAPEQRQKPRLSDFASEADYFRALAEYENDDAPLDPAVAEATGQPAPAQPPSSAPKKGAPARRSDSVPVARSDEGDDGAVTRDRVSQLVRAGRPDAAFALLPKGMQDLIHATADSYKKDGLRPDEAYKQAFADAGFKSDVQAVPEKARPLQVISGKETRFANDSTQAREVQKRVNSLDDLLGAMRDLASYSQKAGRNITGKSRTEIKRLAALIESKISLALEQGVIQAGEAEKFRELAGGNLGEMVLNPLEDPVAGIRKVSSIFARERARVWGSLATNWRGTGRAPAVREVQ
jgi:hypothetical protein